MTIFKKATCLTFFLFLLSGGYTDVRAQQFLIDLSMVDGVDITPDNLFNFQVQSLSKTPADATIKGTIRYRNSDLSISYWFTTRLQPGLNIFSKEKVNAQFQYSSGALKDLFQIYKILPYGTYKYCVEIGTPNGEGSFGGNSECLYRQSEDQFMITLIDPENDAKLYEYNPQLTWVATYSFSSALTYRVRVTEIKEGQNTASAINRNNPVYEEKNLLQNSIVYPVYAKPLKAFQPYAWTVDAYYKGILLGGAEPWKFTIVEDSLYEALPDESSYIDINIDNGSNRYYAVGNMKLKYSENDFLKNELKVKLFRNGKEIKKSERTWSVNRGVNFQTYDLSDLKLKHKEEFEVVIEFKNAKSNHSNQSIKFKYVNPDFVK